MFFNPRAPWYARVLAVLTLLVLAWVAGYCFVEQVATIPGKGKPSITVTGNRAQWAALFYLGLGFLLSSYAVSATLIRPWLYGAIVLIVMAIIGPFLAS